MTLSSQAPRSGSSRSHMFRKRKRRRWPLVALGFVAIGLGALLMFKDQGKGEQTADNQVDATDQGITADANNVTPTASRGPTQTQAQTRPQSPAPTNTRPPSNDDFASSLANPNGPGSPNTNTPSGRAPGSQTTPATPTAVVNTEQLPTTPQTPATPSYQPDGTNTSAYKIFQHGKSLIEAHKLVEGRKVLSNLLFFHTEPIPDALTDDIRIELDRANRTLVFSPTFVDNDPLAVAYKIQSGDRLSRIAPRQNLTSEFVAKINGIDPNRIRVGQTIKLIRGPLHARVLKRRFVMDIYAEDAQGQPIYITSFRVGLGTDDSTPIGSWRIEPGRKAINPDWRDDRTGEYFAPNNPENPIGEYWLALEGTDANTSIRTGYGIHGTVDQDSIGTMASRGCIRLRDDDIKAVYGMLVEGESKVHIMP